MLVPRRSNGRRRSQQKKFGEDDCTLYWSWKNCWEIRSSPVSSGLHWLSLNGTRRNLEEWLSNNLWRGRQHVQDRWPNEKTSVYCRMKNGEPFIKEKKSDSEHKKPKPNHKTSTETTHDPSHKGHDSSEKGHYQSYSIC